MNNYKLILRHCRQNDGRAQLEFYMLFYKSVYNSCLRILNHPQEAEEVMQESFLKIFDHPELYQEEEKAMERMLKRIAINHSIDLYRKRKVEFVEWDVCYDKEEEEEEEDTELRLEAIQKMMKLLPEGYRMVLSLHLIEELEYDEIAEKLGVSASTIRSQFVRARQKLISLIKEHYSHENIINR